MKILSWDCGIKTLSYVILEIDFTFLEQALILAKKQNFPESLQTVKNCIKMVQCDSLDITNSKFTLLKQFAKLYIKLGKFQLALNCLKQMVTPNILSSQPHKTFGLEMLRDFQSILSFTNISNIDCFDNILIEKQMGSHNANMSNVSYMLGLYYSTSIFISPTLKQKIDFGNPYVGGGTVSQNYSLRKKHASNNFILASKQYGFEIDHLPKNILKDVGDAYLQCIAWYFKTLL